MLAGQWWDEAGKLKRERHFPLPPEVQRDLTFERAVRVWELEARPIPEEFRPREDEWPFPPSFRAIPTSKPTLHRHLHERGGPEMLIVDLQHYYPSESSPHYIFYHDNEPFTGIAFDVWPDGTLREENQFSDGNVGFQGRWYSTGLPASFAWGGPDAAKIRRIWYPSGKPAFLLVGGEIEGEEIRWVRRWAETGEKLFLDGVPEVPAAERDALKKAVETLLTQGCLNEEFALRDEDWA